MKKTILILIVLLLISIMPNTVKVNAQTLDEEINSQLNNIDFNDFEEFYSSLQDISYDYNFFEYIKSVLQGDLSADYDNIFSYIFSIFLNGAYKLIPTVLSIIAMSLLVGIMSKLKSSYVLDGVDGIISLICVFIMITVCFNQFMSIYNLAIDVIRTISDFNQIISPILLTLMVASGGNVSASIYKPIVTLLSGSIINVFISILIPLVGVITIFSIISNFSDNVKLGRFIELFSSIIKWIIGISVTVFGVFLSTQGIVSAVHDGISLRATKYAISNSIPLVGGFLSSGLDLVLAGSILVKNAIGISSIFLLLLIVISPVFKMLAFSLMLKICSGFSDCFDVPKVSMTCSALSKAITYLISFVLVVSFLFFISLLLMIFSANSFI